MQLVFDAYTRRARMAPALLVMLPIALGVLAWFPEGKAWWGALSSLVVASGGTLLLAEMGRDRGKSKEPELFASWGGKPTTQLLRHRDAPNSVLLERTHKKLQELVADVAIPSAGEETEDPKRADEVYETLTAYLIENTRDKNRFPLVFEELCNYGFRRNLWGMKPLGLLLSLGGSVGVAVLVVLNNRAHVATPPLVYACGISSLLFLLGWLLWFTPSWVRITAHAYAVRLLAASESLS